MLKGCRIGGAEIKMISAEEPKLPNVLSCRPGADGNIAFCASAAAGNFALVTLPAFPAVIHSSVPQSSLA